MADRHHTRRAPRKNDGFSWGRLPLGTRDATAVEWRLFRRDHTGKLHFEARLYPIDTPRAHIAPFLLRARRLLRERVDEIDLAAMMKEAA